MLINTDKAYLFGLIIGGGVFGNAEDNFRIKLPFKKWGSYVENSKRAGEISEDILAYLSPFFRSIYNINIQYETRESGVWIILCEGDLTELKEDLSSYDIECDGELRQNAKISSLIAALVDDNLKRRFIAGLADTIGSTNPNHRRFNKEVQTISIELNGFDFSRVCELCRLLYSVNCIPDQILWNHPNFHSGKNPYYTKWAKGFKIRILLDQFAEFGSLAFSAKAKSLIENKKLQKKSHQAIPCHKRKIKDKKSCVHSAENDVRLPEIIRGGHYLHYCHVCAVLGCENAPYTAIKGLLTNTDNLIMPFPVSCKGDIDVIENIIKGDPLLANRKHTVSNQGVKSLYTLFQSNAKTLLYGNTPNNGYPLNEIIKGIAFLIADADELNGTRTKGSYKKLIEKLLISVSDLSVEIRKPDLLTPLIMTQNSRGVLIGAHNPDVYKKLISFSPDNEYKMCVRAITEEDLRNA